MKRATIQSYRNRGSSSQYSWYRRASSTTSLGTRPVVSPSHFSINPKFPALTSQATEAVTFSLGQRGYHKSDDGWSWTSHASELHFSYQAQFPKQETSEESVSSSFLYGACWFQQGLPSAIPIKLQRFSRWRCSRWPHKSPQPEASLLFRSIRLNLESRSVHRYRTFLAGLSYWTFLTCRG